MSFQTEPSFQHGQPARTAVLLCNLGTPDEPTAPALRRYLAEFLGDHRVVEIPRPIWWLILHGIILRTRPAKSARKYASIWLPEGSPLKVWTDKAGHACCAATWASAAITSPCATPCATATRRWRRNWTSSRPRGTPVS